VRIASPHGWGIDPVVNALVEAKRGRNLGYFAAHPTMRNRSERVS
jgi:hypothetical protein